ncbi:archaellin/type IV pilin N-terminal domain-containing protein [Halorussus lipolyticus]|uniref:archaellin/type IV pilin N-terminal domain-containing protein n=1 Tax=Halorussus lipolyticus TaxID=3034024 RepID=UPI0023E830E0|nr:archaellin/type IV pilin N-terminal domain-containing protein [Halorussus sp. DT80]
MDISLQKRLPDRGQVGIGTLIVFIAMVLVAAIAAGVLVNTAGFLQTKSEQTGQESSAQVSNRAQVVSAYGNVTDDAHVDYVNLTVMRGSGSEDVNLSAATIEWIGPDTAETLVGKNATMAGGNYVIDPASDEFEISPIQDPGHTVPVLSDQTDRFRITIPAVLLDDDGDGLEKGEEAEVRIVTQHGAVTLYRVTVPQSLSQKNAVTV